MAALSSSSAGFRRCIWRGKAGGRETARSDHREFLSSTFRPWRPGRFPHATSSRAQSLSFAAGLKSHRGPMALLGLRSGWPSRRATHGPLLRRPSAERSPFAGAIVPGLLARCRTISSVSASSARRFQTALSGESGSYVDLWAFATGGIWSRPASSGGLARLPGREQADSGEEESERRPTECYELVIEFSSTI